MSRHIFQPARLRHPQLLVLRRTYHRLSQRVIRLLLDCTCHLKQFLLGYAVDRDNIGHTKHPAGDRASLIKGDSTQPAKIFQMNAAFDQHAVTRRLRDPP